MLDLEATRWSALEAAGGGGGLVVAGLIDSLAWSPTDRDWDEVWEQIAHQGGLYSSAYAALPHLLRLGVDQGLGEQPDFLIRLGGVAAPVERYQPCPEDLRPDFESALRRAGELTLAAAGNSTLEARDYVGVLQAAAALDGRCGPGTQLYPTLGPTEPEAELECPCCAAYLNMTFTGDGTAYLQSVDFRMRPLSKRAPVVPRQIMAAGNDDPPTGDFDWLAGLCLAADQQQVLNWLRLLYGNARCPLCDRMLEVMAEVERSHEPIRRAAAASTPAR